MKRSRPLIGIAIVCIAGIVVFQFVRQRGDKQPSGDTPAPEPKTHPQDRIAQSTEYYLPEPWLKEDNLIVLADEGGRSPEQVALVREDPTGARRAQILLIPAETQQSSASAVVVHRLPDPRLVALGVPLFGRNWTFPRCRLA